MSGLTNLVLYTLRTRELGKQHSSLQTLKGFHVAEEKHGISRGSARTGSLWVAKSDTTEATKDARKFIKTKG